MKFIDKYSQAEFLDQYEFEGVAIYKDKFLHKCWNCGRYTYWIELFFMVPLCSEECFRAKYERNGKIYGKTTKKGKKI